MIMLLTSHAGLDGQGITFIEFILTDNEVMTRNSYLSRRSWAVLVEMKSTCR